MSGHSKWATIKRKKAKTDSARANAWNKLIKEIAVAAKMGGPDPDSNTRLRAAILKAKGVSLPAKNIDSAIKKGVGSNDSTDMEELIYEGYGPGGTAILVKALTDNKTRTVAEVRNIFSKNGGNMGEQGSVAWGFDYKGVILVESSKIEEEELFELVSEAGAEDLSQQDNFYEVSAQPEDFSNVAKALEEKDIDMESAELTYIAKTPVKVDESVTKQLMNMIDKFDDNEDIQDVYHNAELPEDTE